MILASQTMEQQILHWEFLRYFGNSMRPLFFAYFSLFASLVSAQSSGSLNLNYLYNGQNEAMIETYPMVHGDTMRIWIKVSSGRLPASFIVRWEKRDSYQQRQGAVLRVDSVNLVKGPVEYFIEVLKPEKPWLLVSTMTRTDNGRSWLFFRQIEGHYPVNGYLEKNGKKLWRSYINLTDTVRVRGSGSGKPLHFSYYKAEFPSPSPPFADKELKMDRFLFPDSTFTITAGSFLGPFSREGLYLAQEDTTSAQGFAFLVKSNPFPKYNTLKDLKAPLLFVTTREENDAISAAGEDKAQFDKIIIGITKDKERARTFIRNFFRRVETANQYFTTFKEGWKTDRGMVYIVFGTPEIVTFSGQQETWTYKNLGLNFFFVKSGSVYGPDHYVLIRDKDYTEFWYQTIDLWRKGRF